jgi:hypothetical protein
LPELQVDLEHVDRGDTDQAAEENTRPGGQQRIDLLAHGFTGARERTIPAVTGYLARLGAALPALPRAFVPVMARTGRESAVRRARTAHAEASRHVAGHLELEAIFAYRR